jgi:hypothetical protein
MRQSSDDSVSRHMFVYSLNQRPGGSACLLAPLGVASKGGSISIRLPSTGKVNVYSFKKALYGAVNANHENDDGRLPS